MTGTSPVAQGVHSIHITGSPFGHNISEILSQWEKSLKRTTPIIHPILSLRVDDFRNLEMSIIKSIHRLDLPLSRLVLTAPPTFYYYYGFYDTPLSCASTLKELTVVGGEMESVRVLDLPVIRVMRLQHMVNVNIRRAFNTLWNNSTSPYLESLEITIANPTGPTNRRFTPWYDAKRTVPLWHCPELRHLTLNMNGVMWRIRTPHLEEMHLENLEEDVCEILLNVWGESGGAPPPLTILSFSDCAVEDGEKLGNVLRLLPHLNRLSISNCGANLDKTLDMLNPTSPPSSPSASKMDICPELNSLLFEGCSNIKDDAVQKFVQQRLHCKDQEDDNRKSTIEAISFKGCPGVTEKSIQWLKRHIDVVEATL